ncbi:zinc-binding protein A33-like [Protopterus annectens]|uniref:zinc-binding protein A33-like n=1 Tax=Protopterus annectens TaxID=7888 RepID=UPI001CFA3637|nr:zinc-binding protein A33-like [Protopterus annectens]
MYTKYERDCREKEAMNNLCATNGRKELCCREHKERLELFCKDDETFICVMCVPRHSSHNFVFLHEAVSVYKDKIKTTLTPLESKVKQFQYMQNHHEKGIRDIKEDVFNLEKYIKQEFAELHHFLLDKEEQLIQQLKNSEAKILKWMEGNLECIKQEIIVTDSDGNLEDKIKEEDSLKIMEENVKSVENDAMAINSISHSNLEIRQPEPVGLLTVPETFEDVTVTFTEEEWKLLRKQDKELYRDVMVQNYETCVSVGYKIPQKKLLELFKADEVAKDIVKGINITKQKDNFKDNVNSM